MEFGNIPNLCTLSPDYPVPKPWRGFSIFNGFGERKLDLEYLVAPHLAANIPPSVGRRNND
jgi:hypothetical protein